MNLNSTITLAVVFSLFSMIGTLGNLYSQYHNRNNETTNKEVTTAQEFVKINFRLDEFSRKLTDIDRNTDKTTEIVGNIQKEIIDIKHTLRDHEQRLNRLEGNNVSTK